MNNDRFLTRIFDKQEKKMLYSLHADFIGIGNDCFTRTNREGIEIILLKDRYIPMLCTGSNDKNKKLIYQKDIAKAFDEKEQRDVIIEIDYYDFEYQWVGVYQDDYNNLDAFKDFELLGNRHEHPELKDQITKYQDIYKGLA